MSEQLAKLLATENIRVIRKKSSTAWFDVENRVLNIPILKQEISKNVEHLFIGHEVSHALYTSLSTIEAWENKLGKKEYKKYSSAINVVEDARIDSLIKKKYPGLKTDYVNGLKELHEMDFFGIANKDLSELNIIDRINLFFKGKLEVYGTFSQKELDLIERIKNNDSQSTAIELGIELYGIALEEKKESESENSQSQDSSESEKYNNSEDGQTDINSDDSEDEEEDSDSDDFEYDSEELDSNEQIECETQKSFDNNLADVFENDAVEYRSGLLIEDIPCETFIMSYKEILNEFPCTIDYNSAYHTKWSTFKNKSKTKVSHLVKEFELRKAAVRYSKESVSKSGSLDMKKIFSYKYNDDIFKRITTVQDAKNHGMIFLLDWSGSMIDSIHNVIKQLYILTTFCRQCDIPFKVFAFSSHNKANSKISYAKDYASHNSGKVELSSITDLTLLEFFNSKMSISEYDTMWEKLFTATSDINYIRRFHGPFNMQSTPYNAALVVSYFYIPKFKKMFNLEKISLVTLTDGVSSAIQATKGIVSQFCSYEGVNQNLKKYKNIFVSLISPLTKKEYFFQDSKGNVFCLDMIRKGYRFNKFTCMETSVLIRMMRDEGVTCVSIGVSNGTRSWREIYTTMTCTDAANLPYTPYSESVISDSFYDLGVLVMSKDFKNAEIAEHEYEKLMEDAASLSGKALAKKLVKQTNKINDANILLNSFIKAIA